MRCRHCGNESPEGHRFCGLCGKPLGDDARLVSPQANPRLDVAAGNPAPMPARGPEPSRDVSYLLDEAEQEEPRNWGKIAAVAVTLVVVAGFGYQYFLNGAGQSASKAPLSQGAQNSTGAAGGQTAAPSEPAPSQAAASQPAASEHGSPSPDTLADAVKPKEAPAATPAKPAPASEAPSRKSRVKKPVTATTAHTAAKPKAAAVAARPRAKPSAAKAEPTPAAHPVADPVTLAEKYVYGDGVTQDCERGMHTLNPLGAAADLRAMVALGALYTTGTCVPRDLPTAYRWFSKALRKDSENQTLQQDMKQLWGQMTAPERQLAIKLSQ